MTYSFTHGSIAIVFFQGFTRVQTNNGEYFIVSFSKLYLLHCSYLLYFNNAIYFYSYSYFADHECLFK